MVLGGLEKHTLFTLPLSISESTPLLAPQRRSCGGSPGVSPTRKWATRARTQHRRKHAPPPPPPPPPLLYIYLYVMTVDQQPFLSPRPHSDQGQGYISAPVGYLVLEMGMSVVGIGVWSDRGRWARETTAWRHPQAVRRETGLQGRKRVC